MGWWGDNVPEETLSRDYAASIARLRSGLRSAGAADSQVMAAIESLEKAHELGLQRETLHPLERPGYRQLQQELQ